MYKKHWLRPERVAGDDGALDELVRITLHEQAVFVGAGLGLVAVDDEIAGPDRRHESPLDAGGEAGAAAAEEHGLFDLTGDLGW